MTSLMSNDLNELVAAVEWPTPEHAASFMEHTEILWGTEDGRAQVHRWLNVLGSASQFVEGQLWNVADLRSHFEQVDAWNAEHHPLPPAPISETEQVEQSAEKRPRGRPRIYPADSKANLAKLSKEWHEAVQQRREALEAHGALLDSVIKHHKAEHAALRSQWDAYVDSKKNALKNAR